MFFTKDTLHESFISKKKKRKKKMGSKLHKLLPRAY